MRRAYRSSVLPLEHEKLRQTENVFGSSRELRSQGKCTPYNLEGQVHLTKQQRSVNAAGILN